MKEPTDAQLPAYVRDLLAAERAAPVPSRSAEERVRARIAASVVAAGAVGVAGTAGATTAVAGATAKAAGVGALGSAVGVKASLIAVAIAAGATATGGYVVHAQRAEERARATVVRATVDRRTRAVNAVETAAPPAGDSAPAGASPDPSPMGDPPAEHRIVAVTPVPTEASRRSFERPAAGVTAAPAVAGLTEENAPIAAALSALARGVPAEAIAALEQHARRFPAGQLEEEREALWIQALAAAGDAGAARVRADRFRRRFPASIQEEAVAAALAKIP